MATSDDSVARKLEVSRQELLDLGLRNSLLNYRLLRTRGIDLTTDLIGQVFNWLVREGRQLTFLAVEEGATGVNRANSKGEQVSLLDLPEAQGADPDRRPVSRGEMALQTSLLPSALQARLAATYYLARSFVEEQGTNALFLALGMLVWRDADSSEETHKAPLILVPVDIQRSDERYKYTVRYTGDDIGENLSLAAKLRADFGLTLPEIADGEDLDVEAYFQAVQNVIAHSHGWSVDGATVALGFFSFAKFLMFRDLDDGLWPEGAGPTAHPIIRALLQHGFKNDPSPYGDDDSVDQLITPQESFDVIDADSSQTLAILDTRAGRNLVIQGPPGTGKSQTITNLIADAIGRGKSILFVSEKLAALEVVKRRLNNLGLGDACLELHSNKTNKRQLLADLQETLQLGRPKMPASVDQIALLTQFRDRLNEYCAAANSPIEPSRLTPFEAFGQHAELETRASWQYSERLPIASIAEWTDEEFVRTKVLLEELETHLEAIGAPKRHLFWGSKLMSFVPSEVGRVQTACTDAGAAARELMEAVAKLADLNHATPPQGPQGIDELSGPWWSRWRYLIGTARVTRSALNKAIANHQASVRRLIELIKFDQLPGVPKLQDRDFLAQIQLFDSWREHAHQLHGLAVFNNLVSRLAGKDLESLVGYLEEHGAKEGSLSISFVRTRIEALLEKAFAERSALATFDGDNHQQAIQQFSRLDRTLIEYNRARLALKHWEGLPREDAGGQTSVLRREFEKKTRHLPIRQLLLRAGNAVRAIKPVFMMSPLSVANYLAPGGMTFDIVIFDEASQVRPVDAFGALARAGQAVVVGDSKQLPPTNFFDTITRGEEPEEDNVTSDYESILSLFSAQGAASRMLRWHYRSRHESLIAVSNHEFYERRLVLFPSTDRGREQEGLVFHHLPDTEYGRGGSRANLQEAQHVAAAILEHARKSPELTLGVASLSAAQMEVIRDQLDILRRNDPGPLDAFATRHPQEPLFIKNLETVQGDERDVIFVSIGYGRTADGTISMNFGPVNDQGGERRLNVLFTRARVRCEVFTNLTADDIDLRRSASRGVKVLKQFLAYAERGELEIAVPSGREADSPFEEAVASAIMGLGYEVERQVGSGGYFIDLAVLDPAHAGRYVLGVECDGATYHSARSARDRDRLRQQVLEGKGWRIHRVWSTDWFRNSRREMEKLQAAIEKAVRQPRTLETDKTSLNRENTIARVAQPRVINGSLHCPPYELCHLHAGSPGVGLHQVPQATRLSWVLQVVKVEEPIHIIELVRRLAFATGATRVGARMERTVRDAVGLGIRAGLLREQSGFIWSADTRTAKVRDRSGLPAEQRKIDLVAPEEVEAAVKMVASRSHGIGRQELTRRVLTLLGFQRATDEMRHAVDTLVSAMVAAGQLVEQGDQVVMRQSSG